MELKNVTVFFSHILWEIFFIVSKPNKTNISVSFELVKQIFYKGFSYEAIQYVGYRQTVISPKTSPF